MSLGSLVGRVARRNKPEAMQSQGLAHLFRRPEVAVMDGVEGPAEEPQTPGGLRF